MNADSIITELERSAASLSRWADCMYSTEFDLATDVEDISSQIKQFARELNDILITYDMRAEEPYAI